MHLVTCDEMSSKLSLASAVETVEEEAVVVKKRRCHLPLTARWQCAIWENATRVEISAPQTKRTALKCAVWDTDDVFFTFFFL